MGFWPETNPERAHRSTSLTVRLSLTALSKVEWAALSKVEWAALSLSKGGTKYMPWLRLLGGALTCKGYNGVHETGGGVGRLERAD